MDGNGRWAQQRGLPRTQGHREGAKRVDEIVTECCSLGVEYLTLYTFSSENWSRPTLEVNMLMRLLVQHLRTMDKKLRKNGVILSAQGHIEKLPKFVQKELDRVIRFTHTEQPKLHLSLALSYGGRQEILDGVREIARLISEGELTVDSVNEELFRSKLYHPHFPDPDLLIRTGGESRISNFLLWEIAYSEFLVVDEFWPDFNSEALKNALNAYSKRKRRFGKTQEQVDQKEDRFSVRKTGRTHKSHQERGV